MSTAAPRRKRLRALEAMPSAILSPRAFMHRTSGGYYDGRPAHLRYLDSLFVQTALTPRARLIVNIRPRAGKSNLITTHGSAWYLGHHPDHRIILSAHEYQLAQGFAGAARDLLVEHGHMYGVSLRLDSKAKGRWDLAGRHGGLFAAGIGGPITGRGAHLLIIEDPIKTAEQALNLEFHEKQWQWLRSTALSRLEPGASVILVMARWHEDDLAGKAARELGWPVVSIPTIALENDPLGRAPGEQLWPERWDDQEIALTRAEVGPHWWEASYQQNPQPFEGSLFKRTDFRYFQVDAAGNYVVGEDRWPADQVRLLTYVDVAASTRTSADFTVATTVAITPKRQLLVLDVVRVRMEGPDQPEMLEAVYRRWLPVTLKVEKGVLGLGLIVGVARKGVPVAGVDADTDKVSRALVAAARYSTHDVYHPSPAPEWLAAFEAELLAFPHGAHDDQVDTVGYAARDLIDVNVGRVGSVARGRIPARQPRRGGRR